MKLARFLWLTVVLASLAHSIPASSAGNAAASEGQQSAIQPAVQAERKSAPSATKRDAGGTSRHAVFEITSGGNDYAVGDPVDIVVRCHVLQHLPGGKFIYLLGQNAPDKIAPERERTLEESFRLMHLFDRADGPDGRSWLISGPPRGQGAWFMGQATHNQVHVLLTHPKGVTPTFTRVGSYRFHYDLALAASDKELDLSQPIPPGLVQQYRGQFEVIVGDETKQQLGVLASIDPVVVTLPASQREGEDNPPIPLGIKLHNVGVRAWQIDIVDLTVFSPLRVVEARGAKRGGRIAPIDAVVTPANGRWYGGLRSSENHFECEPGKAVTIKLNLADHLSVREPGEYLLAMPIRVRLFETVPPAHLRRSRSMQVLFKLIATSPAAKPAGL